MNWLDVLLIVIFAASLASGIAKGFAKLAVGLFSAVLGFLCALWFYGAAGSFLLPYVSHKGIANFLGFLAVFVLILIAGAVAGKLLSMLFKWAGLSWLDRLLGGVFGLLRGLVLAIALVLALLAFTPKPPPQSVVRSRIAPYVIDTARLCAHLAPREVREAAFESYQQVKDAWQQLVEKVRGKKDGQSI
ncbi:MAG TPA: CvpA family protein [Bryobacteraceae bacterium]|nr:CvpA family protein [Bryobacteraceae bacterium]